jgi:hypothetical protein
MYGFVTVKYDTRQNTEVFFENKYIIVRWVAENPRRHSYLCGLNKVYNPLEQTESHVSRNRVTWHILLQLGPSSSKIDEFETILPLSQHIIS